MDFIPERVRKPLFVVLLVWTLGLLAVFRVLDQPLAPHGIVSFELAGTSARAAEILAAWSAQARLFAAFGLGLDYLFMPSYALTLALAVLLAAGRHRAWSVSAAWVGWGSLVAALFDATENFALWNILLEGAQSAWPAVAAVCATIKFALIITGLIYAFWGGILPTSR